MEKRNFLKIATKFEMIISNNEIRPRSTFSCEAAVFRSDTVAEPHAMSLLLPPPLLLLPYLSTALVNVKEIELVLLANVIQLFLLQVFSTILPHITVAKCAAAAMSIIFWISEQRNKFEPECVVVSIMCVVVFYLSLTCIHFSKQHSQRRGCWWFVLLGV